MIAHDPVLMAAGAVSLLTPRGDFPAELWTEYAAMVLLEPEPALAKVWARRLEDRLGITDSQRRANHMEGDAADADAKRTAFAHWFGITGAQASILCQLYSSSGRYLTTNELARSEGVDNHAIMSRVNRLRQAMDCEAIDSERGAGYRLSEVGLRECQTAMERLRESLGT